MDSSLDQYGVIYRLRTMHDILSSPVLWIVLTAVSEIIGCNKKLKDNSIVELVMHAVMALKPKGK